MMKAENERWRKLEKIYYAALEMDADERPSFLDRVCAGDEALRREVDSLLTSHEQAGSFLDTPALDVAVKAIADEQADSIIGATIGPYKVLDRIGAGGMGEVFLARDSRLGRRVAIKLLPAYFTRDKDRVRRFKQEARAASALNHPNILTIHEIGNIEGIQFISTEFVEGETLRDALAGRRLKLPDVLDVAIQVASALASAHEAGIIHRDIKPENIMRRRDGYVKVLDFGLAKLTERCSAEPDTETLAITTVKTDPGLVMGTVNYMSPEQARGLEVDSRTDIFSLGVVIYEMVAGLAPFKGSTTADVIVAILEKEPPPLSECAAEIPRGMERIISRALAKDRGRRYQTAGELLVDLKELKQELELEAKLQNKDTGRLYSETIIIQADHSHRATNRLTRKALTGWKPRLRPALIAAGAVLLIGAASLYFWRSANLKWARDQAPRIEELAQSGDYFAAYDLAIRVQEYLPGEPAIMRLMPRISQTLTVITEPEGAEVYLKRFAPDGAGELPLRQALGTTPIKDRQIARGDYVLNIEKDGYASMERIVAGSPTRYLGGSIIPPPANIDVNLMEAASIPPGMVWVPGGEYRLVSWERPTDARVRLGGFFIDRYEVTNQQYKEFISAGGYLNEQYWKYPFVKEGETLSWEEAMKEMRDRTGLPGPRGWINQSFPEGKADHPVTDITWYEAAAYAAFRGKQLPTLFQWEKAARNGSSSFAGLIMPWGMLGETVENRANFKGSGTMPAGSLEFGMSPYGCYNMAGNVAEWCFNESEGGYFTGGGSWQDPSYLFGYYGVYPAFYSSNKLGFRCALNIDSPGDSGTMRIEVADEAPQFTPAKDISFDALARHYRYDKAPLDAQVIEIIETDEWRREKITYNGAGGKRAIAYLYLPKNHKGPFQVVNFVPAGDVFARARALPDSIETSFAFLIKSGRAVFAVVLEGFIERDPPPGYKPPSAETVEYLEETAEKVIDIRRGLDYLETRDDIDPARISLIEPSAGGFKLILPAVETRYRSVMFTGANLEKSDEQVIRGANPIDFVPHIRAPKLMLHGRYDEAAPLKSKAEPLFKLLMAPKRLVLFEGGHTPRLEIIAPAVNDWLDDK